MFTQKTPSKKPERIAYPGTLVSNQDKKLFLPVIKSIKKEIEAQESKIANSINTIENNKVSHLIKQFDIYFRVNELKGEADEKSIFHSNQNKTLKGLLVFLKEKIPLSEEVLIYALTYVNQYSVITKEKITEKNIYNLFAVAIQIAMKFLHDIRFTNKSFAIAVNIPIIAFNAMEMQLAVTLNFSFYINENQYNYTVNQFNQFVAFNKICNQIDKRMEPSSFPIYFKPQQRTIKQSLVDLFLKFDESYLLVLSSWIYLNRIFMEQRKNFDFLSVSTWLKILMMVSAKKWINPSLTNEFFSQGMGWDIKTLNINEKFVLDNLNNNLDIEKDEFEYHQVNLDFVMFKNNNPFLKDEKNATSSQPALSLRKP